MYCSTRRIRRAAILTAWLVSAALPPAASGQSVERIAIDSVVAVDESAGTNISHHPQVVFDFSVGVRLSDHWQAYFRPWFRLPRPSSSTAPTPEWDKEIYQAGLRYERPGTVATRVDAGYILSPIGLGMFDARPGINPTIFPHLSYLAPLPTFDSSGPRVSAVAASYPLGAQLTVSSTRWDARAAVVNSAPVRLYAVGAVTNPVQTPVFVTGGGITPRTGVRLGVSAAHGLYATSAEITRPSSAGRAMTMVGGEGELAFGYTKIAGEVMRTSFDTSTDAAIAYEWFVQATQTLTPRWFIAGREEGTSAPPLTTGGVAGSRTSQHIGEATAGFRVSPQVTLRSSYFARRVYGGTAWDKQAAVSVVWSRRWW